MAWISEELQRALDKRRDEQLELTKRILAALNNRRKNHDHT